jgi:hypothetical protein
VRDGGVAGGAGGDLCAVRVGDHRHAARITSVGLPCHPRLLFPLGYDMLPRSAGLNFTSSGWSRRRCSGGESFELWLSAGLHRAEIGSWPYVGSYYYLYRCVTSASAACCYTMHRMLPRCVRPCVDHPVAYTVPLLNSPWSSQ